MHFLQKTCPTYANLRAGFPKERWHGSYTCRQKTIMNYENCRATPLAYAVLKLADYYGCSVEDLLTKNLTERK